MTGADDTTALVLVCKRPRDGVGKQRLVPAVGRRRAREAAELLLGCAVEDLQAWSGPVAVAPAERADIEWARELVPTATVIPQESGNLGERLSALDAALRKRRLQRLVYIGTDAPLLDAAQYREARWALDEHDAVLAPARDGGVILMGARRPWPPLHALPWSTDRLGSALADACVAAGLTVHRQSTGEDIDDWQALLRVRDRLAADRRPARRALHDWLAGLAAA